MSDPYQVALADYVEKCQAAGMSYDETRAGLIGGGWDPAMVDSLLPGLFAGQPGAPPAAPPPYVPPLAAQPSAGSVMPPTSLPPVFQPPAAYPGAPAYWGGENNSGTGGPPPAEVEAMGWSWGGFAFSWAMWGLCPAVGLAWSIANRVWIGLLALIPCVNLIVGIYLGISGHKLVWQNRRFDSFEQFHSTMRTWNTWGIAVFVGSVILNVLLTIINLASEGKLD